LEFVGQYWWLVFPLMGGMATIGGAWERGAKRRHLRRLEVLRAKSEYRAARAAMRGRPYDTTPAPAPAPSAAPAPEPPLTQA
ncbi:hypothetical protein, partial [Salmonella sp. M162]|uniref:hypothetical protein n=1 Tax=Salmonella sp. M162 TaxID=3240289 RepID=UPI00352AFB59